MVTKRWLGLAVVALSLWAFGASAASLTLAGSGDGYFNEVYTPNTNIFGNFTIAAWDATDTWFFTGGDLLPWESERTNVMQLVGEDFSTTSSPAPGTTFKIGRINYWNNHDCNFWNAQDWEIIWELDFTDPSTLATQTLCMTANLCVIPYTLSNSVDSIQMTDYSGPCNTNQFCYDGRLYEVSFDHFYDVLNGTVSDTFWAGEDLCTDNPEIVFDLYARITDLGQCGPVVPEPASLALLGLGLAGMVTWRRVKR